MNRSFVTLLVIILYIVIVIADKAPIWPTYFQTNWILAHIQDELKPPYPTIPISPSTRLGKGMTYYNWNNQSMLEDYYNFCVPIFEEEERKNLPCKFLNTNGTSYLLQRGTCCIFGQPWNPPNPNFLNEIQSPYFSTSNGTVIGRNVNWFILADPSDEAGPFGYSFYKDSCSNNTCAPAEFYFRAITGFAAQFFNNFQVKQPDASIFTIPSYCSGAPSCFKNAYKRHP